jgi:hypothetical protein
MVSTIPLSKTTEHFLFKILIWRSFMKKRIKAMFWGILVLSLISVMAGCASEPDPELGPPNALQLLLNELPKIPVAGKELKFDFGGDTWIAKLDGKNFSAGTFESEDNADGSILTLKQTHIYSTAQKPSVGGAGGGEVGWVKTSGPDIVLEYKKGPPEILTAK